MQHLAAAGIGGYAVSREGRIPVPAGWRALTRQAVLDDGALHGAATPRLDWVIHLEVKQHVDAPTAADIADFEKVNVEGTRRWLEWCAQAGVARFMLFSTIKAAGDSLQPQDEETTTLPTTVYGKSKRRGEDELRQWAAGDTRRQGVILRPAVIYGPGNRANIYSMVKGIDRGRFLLVGKNDNVKSLVSIANAVAAAGFLLGRSGTGCTLYNLVDAQSYSVREIAEMTSEALGRPKSKSLPPFL
ncbi:MAG TPA: NAD-dependent epimerase/dehydratase family protein, partial [Opitutaceae bacterium]